MGTSMGRGQLTGRVRCRCRHLLQLVHAFRAGSQLSWRSSLRRATLQCRACLVLRQAIVQCRARAGRLVPSRSSISRVARAHLLTLLLLRPSRPTCPCQRTL